MSHVEPLPSPDRLVKLSAVMAMTGVGRSSIFNAVKAGTFPAPVKLGVRSVAWRMSELQAWIAARPSARPAPPPPTEP